jgi:hypothetical protein
MAQFEVLSQHLAEGLKKTTRNLNQGGQCPSQDSNWASPEYKSEALPLEPTC